MSTKSALRLPSRAMAETLARGRADGLAGGAGTRACAVIGLGGGGGAGRDTGAGFAGAIDGAFAEAAEEGLAGPAAEGGAPVAPRGVPHRAQNLKVPAFSVMQFGHCFGG